MCWSDKVSRYPEDISCFAFFFWTAHMEEDGNAFKIFNVWKYIYCVYIVYFFFIEIMC